MANEFIELNVIPNGEKPVFHAAQYDVGRPIIIKLKKGEDDFTPTGLTLELQVRKVDNNIVTAASSSVDGNIVTFLTTEQMTACSGTNLCEVQLSDESTTIATLHFFLVVQRDVLNGGLSSASEIHDLEEQIAEIVPEVIGDDYYDKTEVDALIAEHTFDPTNYYDKQETDQAIQDAISEVPIFDPTNYYDKAATNALLADKANTSDLATVATSGDYDDLLNKPTLPDMSNYYTKSETYNKTEIDNALATKQDKIETKTASGDLITISDGGDNIPMKSCEVTIEPIQASGTPTPDNPLPISGHTECNLVVCGKNLIDISASEIGTDWNGDSNANRARLVISCKPNTDLYISVNGTNNLDSIYYFLSQTVIPTSMSSPIVNKAINTGDNTYIILGFNKTNIALGDVTALKLQLEVGNTATAYEPYNGTTYNIPFGQTVYGGKLNVTTGELLITTATKGVNDFGALISGTSAGGLHWIESQADCLLDTNAYCNMLELKKGNIAWRSSTECASVQNGTVRVYTTSETKADFNNRFSNLFIVFTLVEPITVQLTPTEVKTLLGINNIYNDCGATEIEYFTESADNIAALIRVMTGG